MTAARLTSSATRRAPFTVSITPVVHPLSVDLGDVRGLDTARDAMAAGHGSELTDTGLHRYALPWGLSFTAHADALEILSDTHDAIEGWDVTDDQRRMIWRALVPAFDALAVTGDDGGIVESADAMAYQMSRKRTAALVAITNRGRT